MRGPSRTKSTPDHIICLSCGSGKLLPLDPHLATCDSCDSAVEISIVRTLDQIVTLPDILGTHACECGHPEMRCLPDGVFHCPACRSEVLPLQTC